MSLIIFDAEIIKAIPDRDAPPVEGIDYCLGWEDKQNMGVACVCTFELPSGLSRVFLADDMPELAAYLAGKHSGGFNTLGFDLPLLGFHGLELPISDIQKHYDVLAEIWSALGRRHYGWKLDDICLSLFGLRKSGDGAMAPIWWQQGKHRKVIDYCLRDVYLEAKLLKHVVEHRFVTNARGERVELRMPQDVIEAATRD